MFIPLPLADQHKVFIFDTAASNVFEFIDQRPEIINASLNDHKGHGEASVFKASLSLGKLSFRTICGKVLMTDRDEDGLLAANIFKAFKVNNRRKTVSFRI